MLTVRVFVIDGHDIFREGLRGIFAAHPGFELVGETGSAPDALSQLAALDAEVVIVGGASDLTATETTARVRAAHPGRKVLVLAHHDDRGSLRAALEAGASGYLLRSASADALVRAVRAVAAGDTHTDPAVGDSGPPAGSGAELSEREVEVVRLIAHGHSNKEIAARLGLSVKTVETYKSRSMEKLGVRNRVGLVSYAVERGLFKPR